MNNMKKTMPFVIVALTLILLLGFAGPASAADDFVIVETGALFDDLIDAINSAETGQTIKVQHYVPSYDVNTLIDISTKSITLDVDVYTLTVVGPGSIILKVDGTNGGNLSLKYNDSGEFTVHSAGTSSTGVLITGGGQATVTNVRCQGTSSTLVSVTGGSLDVLGTLIGYNNGVVAGANSQVYVAGDVMCLNTGVNASGGNANVTIDGIIDAGTYIRVGGTNKLKGDYEATTNLPGYIEYAGGGNYVWLRGVCEIDTTPATLYNDLSDALENVTTGQTIKLLTDINYSQGITITEDIVTFELNGYDLNVEVMNGAALIVKDGGEVLLDDSAGGAFNVTSTAGYCTGASASYGGKATVTSAAGTGYYDIGVTVSEGGIITVLSNIVGDSYGVSAQGEGSIVTVYGDVMSNGIGVSANNGATVTVNGNVEGKSNGVSAGGGSNVTIDGVITTDGVYIYFSDDNIEKLETEYESTSTLPGYLEYTDGVNFVWVNNPTSDNGGGGGGSGFGSATINENGVNKPPDDSQGNNDDNADSGQPEDGGNDGGNTGGNDGDSGSDGGNQTGGGNSKLWLWIVGLVLVLVAAAVILYMTKFKK